MISVEEVLNAARYREEVVIPGYVWRRVVERLLKAEEDAIALAEYRERDREYLNWSLDMGARMTDALELARQIEG